MNLNFSQRNLSLRKVVFGIFGRGYLPDTISRHGAFGESALPVTSRRICFQIGLMAVFVLVFSLQARAAEFFSIESVKFHSKVPKDGMGVWKRIPARAKEQAKPSTFVPCLEVQAATAENIRGESILAKAYFYDSQSKLLGACSSPTAAGKVDAKIHFAKPVLFSKGKPERLFFEVPPAALGKTWKAVVVFGDKDDAVAACYPSSESHFLLAFSEKELVKATSKSSVTRKAVIAPLVEHVVNTKSAANPKLTLFLRAPKGIKDSSEIRGVVAVCVLANSVESIKRELQKDEMDGDHTGIFAFANQNKLAVLVWGSQVLWMFHDNYDKLTSEQIRQADQAFDLFANAWERGVKELADEYGLPTRGYLMRGSSAAAHWVLRLGLRKPSYFSAIHIHVATSYDKPTPEAAQAMWCLTTGELDPGYKKSLRFYEDCRKLGYPILYKSIMRLGHAGHPASSELGMEFFRFALQQSGGTFRVDALKNPTPEAAVTEATRKLFLEPPIWGDIVNQLTCPAAQVDLIPNAFRTALPTEQIAKRWKVSQ
jgi:predicted esterase